MYKILNIETIPDTLGKITITSDTKDIKLLPSSPQPTLFDLKHTYALYQYKETLQYLYKNHLVCEPLPPYIFFSHFSNIGLPNEHDMYIRSIINNFGTPSNCVRLLYHGLLQTMNNTSNTVDMQHNTNTTVFSSYNKSSIESQSSIYNIYLKQFSPHTLSSPCVPEINPLLSMQTSHISQSEVLNL